MRTAIYGRVSTKEQHIESQVGELRKYCEARKLNIVAEYFDKGVSGSKESRPEFDKMLRDAKKRKFDVLLVWKLDRLSRSLKHLLNTLDTLNAVGVEFICYSDQIDTTTPAGRLMFQMVGAFAEFERELIRERVRSGLERARKQGTKLGRPRAMDVQEAHCLREKGLSYREIGKVLGVSHTTVANGLAKTEGSH